MTRPLRRQQRLNAQYEQMIAHSLGKPQMDAYHKTAISLLKSGKRYERLLMQSEGMNIGAL